MVEAVQGAAEPIYVLDEVELEPDRLDAFLDALEKGYRPAAEARGLHLIHRFVTPPTTTPGIRQSVILVWQLDGVPGFWRMRSQNAAPEIAAWWQQVERLIRRRSRRFAAAPEAIAGFEALGRANA